MFKIRKGQPMVVVVFILSVLIIGFAYVILSNPVGMTYEMYRQDPGVKDVQAYQDFYNISRAIWLWFPFVGVIALILWAIAESHRKDDNYGY